MEKQEENKKEMLGERYDDLVFVSPLLEGFALKNKQWCRSLLPALKNILTSRSELLC